VAPLARLELAHLSITDFESVASTIPPQGHSCALGPRQRPTRMLQALGAGTRIAPATSLCSLECSASLPASTVSSRDRLRTAAIVRDEPARLAHQEAAGGRIPRLKRTFPEPVIAARCHPSEIERRRAEPADTRNARPSSVVDFASTRPYRPGPKTVCPWQSAPRPDCGAPKRAAAGPAATRRGFFGPEALVGDRL